MNKSIKYLGFAFLGSLLFFTLGALRPFIASLNGLGVSTTMSNSVMVGTFRSMLGTVTNMDMPNTAPQHVIFLPQTANTGEFDIGDSAQATGRYLMFSKASGSFLIGHDGTDAFRVNSANGTTFVGGPQTNNNNIDMNGYVQTWDGAGNMVLQIGNDPVHPKILSRGTDFELQSQFGDILLLPGANVTLNNGQFVGNGGGLTNIPSTGVSQTLTIQNVATNSTVNSNLTFTAGSAVTVYATNSLSATNWTFVSGTVDETVIVFYPQLVNRTFVSPTLGTPTLGMYWPSNLDGTIGAYGTLTSGVRYAWSIKRRDTNFYSRMTAWQ